MSDAYAALAQESRSIATLGAVGSLLNWDQETYMPAAGAPLRAEQAGLIASMVHQRRTSPAFAQLIARAEADPDATGNPRLAASLKRYRRDHDKACKLPARLVEELARIGSQSQEAWKRARAASDFNAFEPWLSKMIALTREKAACLGTPPGGEAYDALLDEYEPNARAADIEKVFTPLRTELTALLGELNRGAHPGTGPLHVKIEESRQHAFGLFVLETIGFDLDAGRLDPTTHPFCSGFGPGDTRLTTRYRDQHFTDALYSTMHEAGHGLYEQGLPKRDHFGEPLGDSISLGIHESQSRLWENLVGRSEAFWVWALPHARQILGPALEPFGVRDLYAAVNTATPSLIRVESDEATYNMHVMIRFEIERALFSGSLEAGDVPGVWNEKYREYLGVEVPDDARGCLQDVHWSFGLLGYFPTYTLGNLYAAQMWEAIRRDLPDLDDQMSRGEFLGLLAWLGDKVHAVGRQFDAGELCERLTGRPLESGPLLRHLAGRLRPIYGV